MWLKAMDAVPSRQFVLIFHPGGLPAWAAVSVHPSGRSGTDHRLFKSLDFEYRGSSPSGERVSNSSECVGSGGAYG